jgi:tripartite-type tricarboxylate transporter receptor subunit TctC
MRAAALALAAAMSPASAQPAGKFPPDGPLRYVVGFAPGGLGDTVARLFADGVQKRLGQRVVVENRSGANGMIATEQVARGSADGLTMIQCGTGAMTVSPVLPGLKLPVDMNTEVLPIARLVQANWGIVVPKDSPFRTLAELIAAAKQKPDGLSFGHAGAGSLQQLAAEWLASMAGFKMVGVGYRGIGPAMLDLMGGRLDLIVTSVGDFSAQAQSGQVRLLTLIDDIGTPLFPDAPQASATVPGYVVTGWVGTCGPRGLPGAAVEWWQKASQAALEDNDLRKRLVEFGLSPGYQDAAAFGRTISDGQARWKSVIETTGIRAD